MVRIGLEAAAMEGSFWRRAGRAGYRNSTLRQIPAKTDESE